MQQVCRGFREEMIKPRLCVVDTWGHGRSYLAGELHATGVLADRVRQVKQLASQRTSGPDRHAGIEKVH